MESLRVVALLLLLAGGAVVGFAQSQGATPTPSPSAPIAEVSADRGPCSAEFHVTDLAGNPIYNATITTTVRWGIAHKVELQVATNAGGRARFTNLPAVSKKPLQFAVTYQDQAVTYGIDPGTACQAQRDVPLKVTSGGK
jgi:hypothetical protein